MKNERNGWKKALRTNLRAMKLLFCKYPRMMLSQLAVVLWEALTPYVGVFLSARIIEELSGDKNPQALKRLALIALFSAALIALVGALLKKWNHTEEAGRYVRVERLIFAEKLFDMDYADVDDTKTHELLSKIRQSCNGGNWGFEKLIGCWNALAQNTFTIIGGAALTLSLFTKKVPAEAAGYQFLNRPLTVVLAIALMALVSYASPLLSNIFESYWAKNADMHNFANRMFSFFGFLGMEPSCAADMRIYRQDIICERYNCDKTDPFHSKGIFAKFSRGKGGLLTAASAALSVVFTGIVYLFVCLKALAGAFGVGMVTQYVAAITMFAGGVSGLIRIFGQIKNNAPFLDSIFEFLDIPHAMYKGSLTVEKRRDRDYEVEFKNVSFKYPGSDTYSLKNVNVKFKIGKRLAVVGQNGSGKTTFIKLLCRLYDPTEGEILLNGINIQKYNYREYMSIFSVVFQDFRLFALKLGENVAASVDYDRALAEDCLKKAGFGERLKEMKDGLDTYLYKQADEAGVDISGGEAQKIAIARALYKDAPFIILDEPTAALDPVAESEIYSAFDEIAGDKTAIYISHRLSSCVFCDEIAVFEKGSVVQMGGHQALLNDESGVYYKLWHAQAQYYT